MLTLLGVSLDIEQFKSSTLEMDLLDFFSNNLVTLQSDWLGEGEDMEPWGREELRPIGEEVLGEEVETFISKLFLLPIEILETGTLAYLITKMEQNSYHIHEFIYNVVILKQIETIILDTNITKS